MSEQELNSVPPKLNSTVPRLRAKLAPLVILVSLVIGGLTPWLYQESQRLSARREALFMTSTVAIHLKRLSARFPQLWPYKPQEIVKIVSPLERLGAAVRFELSHGRVIYETPKRQFNQPVSITEAIKLVNPLDIIDVRVDVSVEASKRVDTLLFWSFSALISALISWLLWTIPLKSAGASDRENHRLLTQIIGLNADLEGRVQDRTADLEVLNQRLLTIQEEERARMSRDLHDELGQTLTGLRLHLTTLALSAPLERRDRFDQCLEIVDLGVNQVRKIAYEQRPPELDMLGLTDAVRAIAQRLSRTDQTSVKVISPPLPKLSPALSVTIFRFCQEGITNAIRHGSSSEVCVRFHLEDHRLIVSVEDNGSGDSPSLRWGGGLKGLQSRLKAHEGTLTAQSSLLGGIAIIAQIPLQE